MEVTGLITCPTYQKQLAWWEGETAFPGRGVDLLGVEGGIWKILSYSSQGQEEGYLSPSFP